MWDKVKEILLNSAPIIGTLLGGPVGGIVGVTVSQALGIENDPKTIENELLNNPESLTKIQDLENTPLIQHLKSEHDRKINESKLQYKDTQNARNMQLEALKQDDLFSKRYVYYLASFWSVVGSIYIFLITFMPIPLANQRFADTILGFLVGTIVSTIIGYFFGSSKSSNDKSMQLSNLVEANKSNSTSIISTISDNLVDKYIK